MTTNRYITINNKKYVIITEGYERESIPPKTVREGVNGNTIVSMGPGDSSRPTRAVLFIEYTPATGYGTLTDLQTAADAASVDYIDNIINEATVWGSGASVITILSFKVLLLPGATMPTTGFLVAIEWTKVLS